MPTLAARPASSGSHEPEAAAITAETAKAIAAGFAAFLSEVATAGSKWIRPAL